MNKKIGLMLCVSVFSGTAYSQSSLTVEQRFALLEQRLQSAEMRADKAEAEIVKLKQRPIEVKSSTVAANKNESESMIKLNKDASLKFYGDVEFNLDGASRTGSLTSLKTSANKNWAPGNKERWDINGRILLGVEGIQKMTNGQYAGFNVQPLADMNGKMNLDDAAFFFGQQNDWQVKVGRFEAYDMFPLNQDTFVEYSGNTANNLYSDGYGYIYMMKEGRGRSNSGGNLQLSKNIGHWYFEVNNLVEDGSSLYVDQRYHGMALENQKNAVYVRPVIAWQSGDYSVAAAMESNLVNNAYGYTDNNGKWNDQSGRTGYGLTMTWNTLKNNPQDGTVINLNTAMMNAKEEKDFSAGVNALWHRVEVGYIYAHNKISEFNISGIDSECITDCAILAPGNYDIHTLHTSWQLPNIMDMPNFNIYLGAYTSWLNSSAEGDSNHQPRYGARVRFKYLF
ncbi:porin [Rouxiella sp. S1S-2]|uniref:carbohydrate porin n=1 Tax=Rouxiella sp. S1S-2 TaxID=2653856 RepID=UPI00126419E2|nr:carbohydrate porin [Rouxiella sp. S1S-2]KAB7897504.1 porin [Rouxiella sp. S1S-2]